MSVSSRPAATARPVRVAIDRSAAGSAPEVTYVLRTLLRTAGFAWDFAWADTTSGDVDIAYGAGAWDRADIRIPQTPWPFSVAPDLEPQGAMSFAEQSLLRFPGEPSGESAAETPHLTFPVDVLFGSYWWLTGAREATYGRDRRDNLSLDGRVILQSGLLARPQVSRLASLLQAHLARRGLQPLRPSWQHSGRRFAFTLTHDVDYPEIIRWIEVPRLLATRGREGPRLALDVATGRSHFWTFREWVDFAATLGTQPAFYFMARRGSLLQYALGTPDDFYDVRSPRFASLFRELRERGCEIGLHASYHAYRSADQLRVERERIEHAAGVNGIGNRHHYWHLDPSDPNETLRLHEEAGLRYDSSLGLEYYPGFRRGIGHPFRVFHPGERRELEIVQLPPTWMDDHFGRRVRQNGITDPDAVARKLVDEARGTGGTVVVDYHSRGANTRIYPEYARWLMAFVERHLGSDVAFMTPGEAVASYREHSAALEASSVERLEETDPRLTPREGLMIRSLRDGDIPDTANLHARLFGDPAVNGHSVGTLGTDVLTNVFYRLNLDNDSFFCDVARADGRVVGFSVYSTDRSRVFRHFITAHPARLAWRSLRALLRRPVLARAFVANLAYVFGEGLPFLADVQGWWIVAGVDPAYRTDEAERRLGGPIAAKLFDRMEARLRAAGCTAWYGVVRPDNTAINRFLARRGATPVGTADAQGLRMRYYVKRFEPGTS